MSGEVLTVVSNIYKTKKKQKKTEEKQIIVDKKREGKIRKRIKTTFEWIDVEEANNQGIYLKKDQIIYGIRIIPVNIFLLSPGAVREKINTLSLAFSRLNKRLYIQFPSTEPRLDETFNYFLTLQEQTDDPKIANLIQTELDKIMLYENTHKDIWFYWMIRTNSKYYEDDVRELHKLADNAQMAYVPMTCYDYSNVIYDKFKNPLINSFFFSTVEETLPLAPNMSKVKGIKPFFKSRVAPTYFRTHSDYYELNGHYEKAYTVLNFPLAFREGLLAQNIAAPDYRMEITIEPTKYNTRKIMEKRLKQIESELSATNSKFEAKDLILEQEGIQKTIASNEASQLNLLNVHLALYPSIKSLDFMDRIEQNIYNEFPSTYGWVYAAMKGLHGHIFKETSPLFLDSGLRKDQKLQLGTLMPCTSAAALWPYIFETLDDPNGALVGQESTTGGHILLDIFLYTNNLRLAALQNRLNNNLFISGLSGSGKTTFIKMLIMQLRMKGTRVFYVDPENQVQNMVNNFGGVYIDWKTSDARINVFDLKPQTTDDLENRELIYDTSKAIANVIEDVKILYESIHPEITNNELSMLDEVVIETYKRVGITNETDFRHLSAQDYPTFTVFSSTINNLLNKAKETQMNEEFQILQQLRIKTKPFVSSYAQYFDGYTNFNSDSQFIAFGMKEAQNKSDKLMRALTRVVFQKAWEMTLDYAGMAVLAFDESHKYILATGVADTFAQFARRSRKHDVSCWFITQQGLDYDDESIRTHGRAIINNCAYKFLMQGTIAEYKAMKDIYQLNDNQIQQMRNLQLGQGMLCLGEGRRLLMNAYVTDEQIDMM